MKTLRQTIAALACSAALLAGVAAPAQAIIAGRHVNCAGLPAHVASKGYQNNPAHTLYVYAAGIDQVGIRTYSLTVTAPGVKAGNAGAVSDSLNLSKTKQYCNPND